MPAAERQVANVTAADIGLEAGNGVACGTAAVAFLLHQYRTGRTVCIRVTIVEHFMLASMSSQAFLGAFGWFGAAVNGRIDDGCAAVTVQLVKRDIRTAATRPTMALLLTQMLATVEFLVAHFGTNVSIGRSIVALGTAHNWAGMPPAAHFAATLTRAFSNARIECIQAALDSDHITAAPTSDLNLDGARATRARMTRVGTVVSTRQLLVTV